jgi:hypothetical protein
MRRTVQSAICAAALIALTPAAASAQAKCPEGRTADGQCVNPALAAGMRQSAVIFSQPKLSYTTFPILPAEDWNYRYPNQLIPPPPPLVAPTGVPIVGPPPGP